MRERSGATVVAHELLRGFLADLPGQMELEDTYQADVMRLHGVPEAAIAELYAVSSEHRIYGGSVTVDRTFRRRRRRRGGRPRASLVGERPGHSPTDTIFVVEDERLAIVGDHLIGHISSNPVIHRPLDRPADVRERMRSLPLYLDSLRRTAALDVDLLLPGHGNPVESHRALVDERLDFHDRRKERIFGGLADGTVDRARARARPVGKRRRARGVPHALRGARAPRPPGGRGARRRRRGGRRPAALPRRLSGEARLRPDPSDPAYEPAS